MGQGAGRGGVEGRNSAQRQFPRKGRPDGGLHGKGAPTSVSKERVLNVGLHGTGAPTAVSTERAPQRRSPRKGRPNVGLHGKGAPTSVSKERAPQRRSPRKGRPNVGLHGKRSVPDAPVGELVLFVGRHAGKVLQEEGQAKRRVRCPKQ